MKLDITNKLRQTRPVLEIAGNAFEVDDTKDTMLAFNERMQQLPPKTSMTVLYEEGVRTFLGEDAARIIGGMGLSVPDYRTIFIAVLSLANEEDFDTAEARFLHSVNGADLVRSDG